eukprot:3410229-Rhodomonas_salina.2
MREGGKELRRANDGRRDQQRRSACAVRSAYRLYTDGSSGSSACPPSAVADAPRGGVERRMGSVGCEEVRREVRCCVQCSSSSLHHTPALASSTASILSPSGHMPWSCITHTGSSTSREPSFPS